MLPPAVLKLVTFTVVFVVTSYVFIAKTSTSTKQTIKQTLKTSSSLSTSSSSSTEETCPQNKVLQGFCSVERCVNPFKSYNWAAMMNYAPKYGLANCAIPKSLSTVSMAIFCYLYDADNFAAKNRTMPGERWLNRLCKRKNEADKPDHEKLHSSNWTHIVVVRHPVDRFLSGFVDKCVNALEKKELSVVSVPERTKNWCHGCGTDMTCFLEKHYKKLSFHHEDPPKMPMEDHFYPQNWYCGFQNHINDYKILKYPTNQKDMPHFFAAMGSLFTLQGVPKKMIETISTQLMGKKTHHATSGLKSTAVYRKKLLADKELLKLLVKIYYYDFIIFGFDFPSF